MAAPAKKDPRGRKREPGRQRYVRIPDRIFDEAMAISPGNFSEGLREILEDGMVRRRQRGKLKTAA